MPNPTSQSVIALLRNNSMLKNIVWSDPSRDHDLPPGWRAHTAPSERGSKVVQFDMQVLPATPNHRRF
jgi:hypothetical protein